MEAWDSWGWNGARSALLSDSGPDDAVINLAGKQSGRGPRADWKGRFKMADLEGETGVQIRPYTAPNWVTKRGVDLKRREIERKGLPVFKHCLFMTLTVPEAVSCPKKAYEVGKDQLRRFLARFRKALGRDYPWAWKLEFQENGYPHWHLIIGYRKRVPRELLPCLSDWWGLGLTNIRQLREKEFGYLFKYVSKIASADGDEEAGVCLPSWVLDYKTIRKDGRPSAGIRFWQTGGGFYTKAPKVKAKDPAEQKCSRVPYTLREQLRLWSRKAVAYRKDFFGNYAASKYFYFKREFGQSAQSIILGLLSARVAPVENALVYRCHLKQIAKEIPIWTLNKIKQLQAHPHFQSVRETVCFSVD
ncbi:MAG: hypothetical protein EA353_04390 [Puniceicoccaceae bacterium]|nr:MAG: hypothetical protein EA353_04390 [Puniceicoccaceae bacterium]